MTNLARLSQDPFFVNTDFFHAWRAGLGSANRGKVGAPFEYPAPFFTYLAYVRVRCDMDYRGLESFAALLLHQGRPRLVAQGIPADVLDRFRAPHFTQIRRRLADVTVDLDTGAKLAREDPMHLLLDVDGARVATISEWVRVYLGKRISRGWYRLNVAPLVSGGPGPVAAVPPREAGVA